ncbi:MAG: hypothetical protein Hals2KO_19220 [Halioglobus sp.]
MVLVFLWLSLIAIPRQSLVVERIPLTTSPADVGLRYESFNMNPDDSDLQLAGWWMPADSATATMVFIHGGGSNRHSEFFRSLRFYRAMVDNHINVAAIDLRNHGESGAHAPGMQFGRTEAHDALAALRWARERTPDLPLVAMGISMGGATVIHAAHNGADVDALILLDPLLHSHDVFARGGWVQTGLPAALFAPAAWAATTFYGLPAGRAQALDRAAELALPILLVQDPDDPVTRLPHARELAARNPRVRLWLAPTIPGDHPDLAWKARWGSHVAAFEFFPEETTAQIRGFVTSAVTPPAAAR